MEELKEETIVSETLVNALQSTLTEYDYIFKVTPLAKSSFSDGAFFMQMSETQLVALLQRPAPVQIQQVYSQKYLIISSLYNQPNIAQTQIFHLKLPHKDIRRLGRYEIKSFLVDFSSSCFAFRTDSSILYAQIPQIREKEIQTLQLHQEADFAINDYKFHPYSYAGILCILHDSEQLRFIDCLRGRLLWQKNLRTLFLESNVTTVFQPLSAFSFLRPLAEISFTEPYIVLVSGYFQIFLVGPIFVPKMLLKSGLIGLVRKTASFLKIDPLSLATDLEQCDYRFGQIQISDSIDFSVKHPWEAHFIMKEFRSKTPWTPEQMVAPIKANFPTVAVVSGNRPFILIVRITGDFMKPGQLKGEWVCMVSLSNRLSEVDELIATDVPYSVNLMQRDKRSMRYWRFNARDLQNFQNIKEEIQDTSNTLMQIAEFRNKAVRLKEVQPGYFLSWKYVAKQERVLISFREIEGVLPEAVEEYESYKWKKIENEMDSHVSEAKGRLSTELIKRAVLLKEEERELLEAETLERKRALKASKREKLIEKAVMNSKVIERRMKQIFEKMPYYLKAKHAQPAHEEEVGEMHIEIAECRELQEDIRNISQFLDQLEGMNEEWRRKDQTLEEEQEERSQKVSQELLQIHERVVEKYRKIESMDEQI